MSHLYKFPLPILAFFLVITSLLFIQNASAQTQASIAYHFPMDGSTFVPGNTSIIFRPTEALTVQASDIVVTGSRSGPHDGTLILSDDGKTFIFTPLEAFDGEELVSVSLNPGIQTKRGGQLAAISFSFKVGPDDPTVNQSPFLSDEQNASQGNPHTFQTDSTLPSDFPALNITTNASPSPGYLFFSTLNFTQFAKDTGTSGSYRIVLDQNGNPVYYAHAFDSVELDFQPQPNGLMTFFELPRNKWFAMDSNYNIVDSFWIPQTYPVDTHDMELLTHHHALMLSYYPMTPYDLSPYGGSKTATFIGCAIVETDSLRNPIWIWRSWDPGHFLDTDATYDDPATENPFDAVHMNSVQVDTDGNILLSSRELDEVTKISRQDGHIMWRLGGKHNQFTFVNDSIHFSHQHAVRRIANGDITLFDDGNFGHAFTKYDTTIVSGVTKIDTMAGTTFARACEYNVDTSTWTATLVWHYDHDSTVQALAMGYVQRLTNGNTLINWGVYAGAKGQVLEPAITEVTPDKRIAFELTLPLPYVVYRAFKFPSPKYDTGYVAEASPYTLLAGVATQSSTPSALTLGAPYPNPSNSNSMVSISAAGSSRLTLELYDPLGRQVRTYFSGIATSPEFSLELLTNDLPNGAYELVLHGNGGTVSRQFNILH